MSLFDTYKIKTQNADWQGICSMHGIDFDSLWTKQEFSALSKLLKPDEIVFGFTAGTIQLSSAGKTTSLGKESWLVVLTSSRFLLIRVLPNKSVKAKSLDLTKISGVVASQDRALGQLVIVLNGGIITVENAMVNTVRNIEGIYRQIKESSILPQNFKAIETKPSISTIPKPSAHKQTQKDSTVKSVPAINPFADDIEEYEEEPSDADVNTTIAVLIALFLGGAGVHDFVWGRSIFGIEKIAFSIAAWRTAANGHEIISSLFILGISVWIFIDILRMLNGKFFKEQSYSKISQATRIVVLVVCVVGIAFNIGNLFSEISDNAKKDYGGHVYHDEIVIAYNQNMAQAKAKYENRRFSIIGQVSSVEKNFWGDYIVKLEGGGLGYGRSGNNVKEMKLYFSSRQSKEILQMQKGNRFAASCIGRGLTSGTYTAEKCVLKHVVRYR